MIRAEMKILLKLQQHYVSRTEQNIVLDGYKTQKP